MPEAVKTQQFVGRIAVWGFVLIAAGMTGVTMWQSGWFDRPARIALIPASPDSYWDDAITGAKSAAERFNIELTVRVPKAGEDEQSTIVRDLLSDKIDGIAISPINPAGQASVLNEAATGTRLVTFDSDSPVQSRLSFVGADNYTAGRRCGELVKQVLPDGGNVAIVIGSLDKENGQRRRQGLIDELLDRSFNPERPMEAVDAKLAGSNYTIVGTLIDENDPNQAQANVMAALRNHAALSAVIGLYAYHAPAILNAVQEAGKADQVQIIGFDYHPETLDAIEAGQIYATVTQDTYNYGYQAIRVLAEAYSGKSEELLPLNETLHFPCLIVKKDDVPEFRNSLKQRKAGA